MLLVTAELHRVDALMFPKPVLTISGNPAGSLLSWVRIPVECVLEIKSL